MSKDLNLPGHELQLIESLTSKFDKVASISVLHNGHLSPSIIWKNLSIHGSIQIQHLQSKWYWDFNIANLLSNFMRLKWGPEKNKIINKNLTNVISYLP